MEFFINYMLILIPEFYIIILLSISLLGYNFSKNKFSLQYISAILALIWYFFSIWDIIVALKVVCIALIGIIIIKLILNIEWSETFFIAVIATGLLTITEVIMNNIVIQFIDYQLITNNIFIKLITQYLGLVPLIIGLFIVLNKKIYFEEKNKKIFKNKITKKWFYVFFFTLIQIYLVSMFYWTIFSEDLFNISQKSITYLVVIIYSILWIVINIGLIKSIIALSTYTENFDMNDDEIKNNKNLKKLIKKLRVERHDNISQIQAIYGLVNEKKYDTLKKYLEDLVDYIKTSSMNHAYSIKNIPVSALLNTKMEQNAEKGVKLNVITETSNDFSQINEIDLIKIISNIYDNALRVLTENSIKNPYIELLWTMEDSLAIIKISNNGPKISKKLIDRIFTPGFTTKENSENSGYGLAIVKETVSKYNGVVDVDSNKDVTSFTIKLPLNKDLVS